MSDLLRARTWPGWLLIILWLIYQVVSVLSNLNFLFSLSSVNASGFWRFLTAPSGQLAVLLIGMGWLAASTDVGRKPLLALFKPEVVAIEPTSRYLLMPAQNAGGERVAEEALMAVFRCDRAPIFRTFGKVKAQIAFVPDYGGEGVHVYPGFWFGRKAEEATLEQGEPAYLILGLFTRKSYERGSCTVEAIEPPGDAKDRQRLFLHNGTDWQVHIRLIGSVMKIPVLEADYTLRYLSGPSLCLGFKRKW
jgi:hypothetical protein